MCGAVSIGLVHVAVEQVDKQYIDEGRHAAIKFARIESRPQWDPAAAFNAITRLIMVALWNSR